MPSPARSLTFLVVAGCLISLVSFGVRSAFGLFNEPWSSTYGQGREVFALAISIQNLLWGLGQPFAGAIADRFGPWRVMVLGGLFYAAGTALSAVATDPLSLNLTAGVMVGLGMGGASYITVLGALGRIVPPERRAWVLGLGTAAGSLGQFVVVPLGQAFTEAYGWPASLVFLGAVTMLVPLLAMSFRGQKLQPATVELDLGLVQTLRAAFGHGSFVLLIAGFFVCGFQLAFITTHLPAWLTERGFSGGAAAWSIAVIGLFNVAGCYLAGLLDRHVPKRWLLSFIYAGRAVAIAVFVLVPPTTFTLYLFSAVMGLLWLSTAPPTTGLVALMFGTRYLTMLFGVVFFSHQVGSFLGAWLGGVSYAASGSYDPVWWASVGLGVFAALVHLPIVERPAPRFATAPAE